MPNVQKDLGPVSAYAIAVQHGYTGTEEEWAALQIAAAANAAAAAQSAQEAANTLAAVEESVAQETAKAVQEITAQETASIVLVEEAASAAGATQVAAIAAKGKETLASIPEDYTELAGEVGQLSADIGNAGIICAESMIFPEKSAVSFDVKWVDFKPQPGRYRANLANIVGGNYHIRLAKAKTTNVSDNVKTIVDSISSPGNRTVDFYLSEDECAEIAYIGLCAIHTAEVSYDFTLFFDPLLGMIAKNERVHTGDIALEIEQGEISGTGALANNANYVRTKDYIWADGEYIINSASGQAVSVLSWDKATYGDFRVIAWLVTANNRMLTFDADRVYKIVARKADSSAMTPAECDITVTPAYPLIAQKNPNMLSIAHRGYSPSGSNHNKLSGYIAAAKRGFDYGETDLRETADGVIVCCHDATFVDATTGETVTIAEKTYDELKSCNYYGETIATLEEVVATCKEHGLGIVLDQLGTASIILKAAEIVRKYQMVDRTIFFFGIGADSGIGLLKSKIPDATIGLVSATSTLDAYITYANQIAPDTSRVVMAIPYTAGTPEEFAAAALEVSSNVRLFVWTVNDMERYTAYMPYVSGIISDLYCYNDYRATI